MRVHLINPSNHSFGSAVIVPRWLYVLAGATPAAYGDPIITDEALEPTDFDSIEPGDVVGIGIHTGNARTAYDTGRKARERGATVIFGGIHSTLYPDEALELGGAHSVVRGDGDLLWSQVLSDCSNGGPKRIYDAGHVDGERFQEARWDLIPADRYMFGSVQTIRGCPKHCSFCSVWRTDGQKPRQNVTMKIVREIVQLRRLGFRIVALADDNFYPVTLTDLNHAARRADKTRLRQLEAIRAERFELMEQLAPLPKDMIFFTQITMEAAEDTEFLTAMSKARIKGCLVGVETVSPAGLKDIYKDFNLTGEGLVKQLRRFREHGVFILGAFVLGLPSDTPESFPATAELADQAELAVAQFTTLTLFPGTVDFERWEKTPAAAETIEGVPLNKYWLVPHAKRPKLHPSHPLMSYEEICARAMDTWKEFYRLPRIWRRACKTSPNSWRGRLLFTMLSRLYYHMYAKTGLTTDSARRERSPHLARILAKLTCRIFRGKPMPDLPMPEGIMEAERPGAPASGAVDLHSIARVSGD